MSVIEKVAEAIRDLDDPGAELAAQYARAALTALLEGLEPVAFIGRSPSGKLEELTCRSGNLDADELAVGWTETPLYDLSDVRGEL